jgi:hypothetical protein
VGNIQTNGEVKPKPLPVVADANAPIWPDRIDGASFWYAPALTVVQPAADADPATSPFLFSFTRTGVTAGSRPATALNGTVRITLRQSMSEATKNALAEKGNPTAKPVPVGGLSLFLDLPFRDETADQTLTQRLAATVEQTGDTMIATIELINDWVRLCYGALAYPDFQPNPATLSAAYAFRAYVPESFDEVQYVYGGKIALTQFASSRIDLPQKIDRPIFSADDATMHLPNLELKYAREAPARSPITTRLRRPNRIDGELDEAIVNAHVTHQIAVSPELEVSPEIHGIWAGRQYAMQTIVHQETPTALFPCSTLGGFYVQEADGVQSVVGCQDALRLGEIAYRAYEELSDLRTDHYRVFHSLQQPARYLVLPAAYRIARYGPTEPAERAYRPTAMVYASLDPNPVQNRYFFRATLQADIPEYERHALESALKPFTPHGHTAQLDYPTEPAVQVTTTYAWAVPQGVAEPEVQQMWDGFQVSVSTDLTNAVLLITLLESDGLEGQVTFTLTDGTALNSRLVLDGNICGPWKGGPIETNINGTTAKLRNRIEQTINLFELVATDAAGAEQRVQVEQSLAPNATATANLTQAATAAYPVYDTVVTPLSLTERDVFVEDVVTNVLFVNLVNYANHNLQRLQGQVRLKGAEHQEEVNLTENGTASITMTLPLTTYLEQQVVEYQITKTFTNGDPGATTSWREWNLATQGVTISLTWESIA